MTAPLSTGNSRFRTYFFYRFSAMKSRFIAHCIMALFSFPLLGVCADVMMSTDIQHLRGPVYPETPQELNTRLAVTSFITGAFTVGGLVLVFILFIQGHLTAKESFRYLHDKKYTDMDMSLPTDADIRFFGDMLAGLSVYFIPVAAAVVLAQLILIPGYSMHDEYNQLAGSPVVNSSMLSTSLLDLLQYGSIIAALAFIMQYFFSLMLISFCGRKLTANLVPVIFNIAVPITIYAILTITGACSYGINVGAFVGGSSGLRIVDLCPVGMFTDIFFFQKEDIFSMLGGELELKAVLVSAICGTAAYFMIKHRRAERTGNAFVYKGGRYATELMIMLCSAAAVYLPLLNNERISGTILGISSILYSIFKVPSAVLIAAWTVINLIIFAVIELVSREKLRKPVRLVYSVGRFAASAGISFLVCFAFANSDGFNTAGYVPAAADVEELSITGYIPDMYSIGHYSVLRSPESIEKFAAFHKRIVDERPQSPYSTEAYNPINGEVYADVSFVSLDFTYRLKNGKHISRSYHLPLSYTEDFLNVWFDSGAFASAYVLPEPDSTEEYVINVPVRNPLTNQTEMQTADIPYSEYRTALMTDAQNATLEDIFLTEGADMANIQIKCGESQYYSEVRSTFENTMALLREHNCDPFANKMPNAVGYYLQKQTSFGSYSSDTIFQWDNGEQYRRITEEEAKELIPHCACQTIYKESRDVYFITYVYELTQPDTGKIYYTSARAGAVLETYCDKAAQIYESSPELSGKEINALIYGNYDNFSVEEASE